MKPLLKVMLTLGAIFVLTFVLGRAFGFLTVDHVRNWLEMAQKVDLIWVFATVITLLFIDIFVSVPTLVITTLAGFFLGFPLGAIAAFIGMSLAAFTGYTISNLWGEKAIALLIKDEKERYELVETFHRHGPVMIILSRAAPMVPEVAACMAGATKMRSSRYGILFTISTLPYALIAAYAGSISTMESPQPAIYAALSLYCVLWAGWYIFRRSTKKSKETT